MKLHVVYRTQPCSGFTKNGDAIVVRSWAERDLLAVVDALGHGPAAAVVADMAVEFFASLEGDESVGKIVHGLDRALRGSRGAQGLVCVRTGDRMHGCGVGNVDMRCLGLPIPVSLTPGILGAGVRNTRVFEGTLAEGARFAIFSDGISFRTPLRELAHLSAQRALDELFERHRRDHDDASLLIADVAPAEEPVAVGEPV